MKTPRSTSTKKSKRPASSRRQTAARTKAPPPTTAPAKPALPASAPAPVPVRTRGTGGSAVVERCQLCGGDALERVLFLGYLPPVNTMPPVGTIPREQPAYPALLLHCPQCQLVQLGLTVDPQILFPPEYPYTSGTTRILRENFAELYAECTRLVPLRPDDLVVDIGSNDGTLLSNFAPHHRVQGIEPSDQGRRAIERGIPTRIAFFDAESARAVRAEQGAAALVTATNVFAHIEDVHATVESVLELLAPGGVFISESHYLRALMETVQYDTIYHEHLRYYSLASLQYLFGLHGLEIIHARRIPTHGGSIRVYAARRGARAVLPSVAALLEEERQADLSGRGLVAFRERVVRSKLALHRLLLDLKQQPSARIYGVGAPSRASTLINYVGLDDGIIDCVLEIAGSHKIGKYVPGTLIPVEDEARLFTDPPEYALLFSWHIADELIPKLAARGYRGKFIVPLPEPRVVEAQSTVTSAGASGAPETTRTCVEAGSAPLVSLIVCTKNGMPFLPEAIHSVRRQTYRQYELVIQDAASTDGSREFLQALSGFPAVELVSEPDGGIGDGFNRAVRRCHGDIVGSIDADNLMDADALGRVVDRFAAHPECAAVYGASHTIDAGHRILSTWVPPKFDLEGVLRCEVVPPFGQSFFRRALCGGELRFDPALKTCADFDLWLRLGHLSILQVPDVLGSTRLSTKSMSCRPEVYPQFCADKITALRHYFGRHGRSCVDPRFRQGVGGIYAWAAECVLNLDSSSPFIHEFLEQADAWAPGSLVVQRLLARLAEIQAATERHVA